MYWEEKITPPDENHLLTLYWLSPRCQDMINFVPTKLQIMSTLILTRGLTETVSKASLLSNFYNWCKGQSEYRLLWLGIVLVAHGCILTPLTILAVLLAGTNIILFMLATMSMAMALVTNLAALPTRITIPIFLLSILIDLGIVIACISIGFHAGNAF